MTRNDTDRPAKAEAPPEAPLPAAYDDWVLAAASAPRPDGIVITPAMIVAGVDALGYFARDVEGREDCVEAVFLAMALARSREIPRT